MWKFIFLILDTILRIQFLIKLNLKYLNYIIALIYFIPIMFKLIDLKMF